MGETSTLREQGCHATQGSHLKNRSEGAVAINTDHCQATQAQTSERVCVACKVPPRTPAKKPAGLCEHRDSPGRPLCSLLYIHLSGREVGAAAGRGPHKATQGLEPYGG